MNKKPYILLVDDEPDILEIHEEIMHEAGFENVLTASNGQEALALIKENPPAMVITDMHMPKMNGAELLHEIRSQFGALLVVIVSAGGPLVENRQDVLKDSKTGANCCLTKPIDASTFRKTITNLLQTLPERSK